VRIIDWNRVKRTLAVIVGAALGVGIMLGILQPWRQAPKPVPAPPPPVTRPEPGRIESALALIENDKIAEAREVLEDELKADVRSAQAYALLALADLRSANLLSAQARLAQAAALDPENFEVALVQGHVDMVRREFRAAARSYSEALHRRPKDGRALGGRAAARFELKEYAGAVEDADAALAEKFTDARFTRAAAYGALGRHEDAVRDWTAYLAEHPKDADAWMNRGNAHERLGKRSAAVADWREAVKLDPRLAETLEPLMKN
jgi:tetratricopeptide (TPR) repeat protein